MFGFHLQDEFLCDPAQVAIRTVDHPQLGVVLEVLPALLQLSGMIGVDHEVDREQLVGVQALSVAQRLDLGKVDRIHEDEHPQPRVLGQLRTLVARHLQDRSLGAVLPVQPYQAIDQDREDHDDQPGTLGELGHHEDADDDRRHHPRREIDHHFATPTVLTAHEMVFGHAEAGHRERGEHPDREERHQRMDRRAGHQQQCHRKRRQRDDPVGKDQSVATFGQRPRQKAVLGNETRECGEPVEPGVGAGEKDCGAGRLNQEVEDVPEYAAAEDRASDLGEHRWIFVQVRGGVGDKGKPSDTGQKDPEDARHESQHPTGVYALRLPKDVDGVGNRLDTGQ